MASKFPVLAGAALLTLAGAASAQIPWTQPGGAGSFFTYANGQNATGLFGSPTLIGDTFYFFPVNFVANSVNGVPAQATDTFNVDLYVNSGFKFDGVSIAEYGDFTIQGQGSVDANASLVTQDLLNPRAATDAAQFNPTFPQTSGTNQNWSGSASRDLTLLEAGTPFYQIHLTFSNNLVAISTPGGSAVIRKTVIGNTMAVTIVPEPGVVALAGLSGLVALRRRRR